MSSENPNVILSADERAILAVLNREGALKSHEIFDLIVPVEPPLGSAGYPDWAARWNSLYGPLEALDKAGFLAEMTTTVHDEYHFGRYQVTEAGREAFAAGAEAGA